MIRRHKPAYPGPLNEPIVRVRRGLASTFDEERVTGAIVGKLELLFEHYQIAFDEPKCWRYLALRLAIDHVPGFAIVDAPPRSRGRPKKWEVSAAYELVGTIDAIATERQRGIKDAIRIAAKRFPQKWPTKSGSTRTSPKELNALETRYYECKERIESFGQAMKALFGRLDLGIPPGLDTTNN